MEKVKTNKKSTNWTQTSVPEQAQWKWRRRRWRRSFLKSIEQRKRSTYREENRTGTAKIGNRKRTWNLAEQRKREREDFRERKRGERRRQGWEKKGRSSRRGKASCRSAPIRQWHTHPLSRAHLPRELYACSVF